MLHHEERHVKNTQPPWVTVWLRFLLIVFLIFIHLFTSRKRNLQRLCFCTCLSVILFTGGGGVSASVHAGIHPPWHTPPRTDTPWANTPLGVDTPPGSKHPPPAQCMLGNTANKRAVRILLECILVPFYLLRNHINIVINQWQIQEFPEEEVRHFPEERRA